MRSVRSQQSLKSLRRNFAVNELPLLQAKNPFDGSEQLNPVAEVDNEEGSYDLVAPYENDGPPLHSLERQADLMFSSEHMLMILTNARYLARFREFLLSERPKSMQVLTYYLNANKALKAFQYANSLVRLSVDVPTPGVKNAKQPVGSTAHAALEARVQDALEALTAEELPAFITSNCINITSRIVEERVRGTLPDKFKGTSEALAEVFCLTDPSRPDNPIIFASGGECTAQSKHRRADADQAQNSIVPLNTAWTTSWDETADSCRAPRPTRTVPDAFGRALREIDTIQNYFSTSKSP